ncbi:MAG: HlyD family efflux transporter periplasmic adaptor subunit [Patescibacteria group bacterium]
MKFVQWFIRSSLLTKIVYIAIILALGWFTLSKLAANKSRQPQHQTAIVEKGTLIVSLSGSGTVSSANSATVTTQTSGVVKKLFVENGQQVKSGDSIAEVDLDMDGKQRAAQALASYQGAKNSLDGANATYYSLQSTLYTQWKSYMDISQNSTYQNSDGSAKTENRVLTPFTIAEDDWLAAEAKFKNQQGTIAQAQTSLNSAWASYQQASPIIYAPISGTISGLSLQIGSVLTAQTGSSGNSTAQRIANIKTTATPTITVNLTEVDAPKVKIGNNATITMDALPGKSYTGKVVSIDTIGTVSSGVTSYPSVIKLDTGGEEIFSNMSAQANIITDVKDNALLVPTAAIQNQGDQSTVRVMQKGNAAPVNVEVGLSSSTQTEILSGISEGDTVVTSVSNGTASPSTSNQTRSVFGGGGFGGGGMIRGGR